MSSEEEKVQTTRETVTLSELVAAADGGDAEAIKRLRQALDAHPEIWQKVGNLAAHVEATWIRLAADKNALALESIRREAERMRLELVGTSRSPIEKLLVDQVIACWLQLKHAEIVAGSGEASNLMQARFHDQRLEKAQRRYIKAINTLSQMRGVPQSALDLDDNGTKPTAMSGESAGDVSRTSPGTLQPPLPVSAESGLRIFPESRKAV